MVESRSIVEWSVFQILFENQTKLSPIFRPPFEYWTFKHRTSKSLLFRSPLYIFCSLKSVYLCVNSKCFLIFVLVQNHASEERRAFQSQSLVQPQENQQSSGKQFYSIFANQICSLYLRSSLLIM